MAVAVREPLVGGRSVALPTTSPSTYASESWWRFIRSRTSSSDSGEAGMTRLWICPHSAAVSLVTETMFSVTAAG